jgi:hypothetical protein
MKRAVLYERAFSLAKEFLDAYDMEDEGEALAALEKKYQVRAGESILATMFLLFRDEETTANDQGPTTAL